MESLSQYKVSTVQSNAQKYYKVYDSNGNFVKKIPPKNESEIKNEYLKGATCFVIYEKQNNGKTEHEVLIEKRVNKGLTPGKLDLVSGHLDCEEIGFQAIIRELDEEVGIKPEETIGKIKKIGKIPLTFESKGKSKNFFIDFFYLKRNTKNVQIQNSEVDDVMWIPLEEALQKIQSGKTKFPKEGNYSKIFEKLRQELYNSRTEKNKEIIKD